MKFYIGLHLPTHAKHFEHCMVSIQRLKARKSDFPVNHWILDSGAFTQINRAGGYTEPVSIYAEHVKRWRECGSLDAAVSQDYMCEPFMLAKTGLTIPEHQKRTIERYDELLRLTNAPQLIMPVLQGYAPETYVEHMELYGDRLAPGMWVGVGSVCKRNGKPSAIIDVLSAIKTRRPDLRLHGFGIKYTSLTNKTVRTLLYSADSMAWSFNARAEGRGPDANKWEEAERYRQKIVALCIDDAITRFPTPLEIAA